MSKKSKIERAEKHLFENEEIVRQICILCRQYRYHQECAYNLYKKAQTPENEWPYELKYRNEISIVFD